MMKKVGYFKLHDAGLRIPFMNLMNLQLKLFKLLKSKALLDLPVFLTVAFVFASNLYNFRFCFALILVIFLFNSDALH